MHSPNMLLQRLFSFLCSQYIHCNPFFPLSLHLLLAPVLLVKSAVFIYLFFLFLQTINLCSSSPCLFPSLRKSYQAACQIIRWDICLKTHLQKGIIPAQRHNFNQTRQQNVFKICQTDIKSKTEDREREQQRRSNKSEH